MDRGSFLYTKDAAAAAHRRHRTNISRETGAVTLCGILDSRNDKADKLRDQCEEMRAQVERLCDGHQAASGTTQIQAISGSQMKSIRR